jgi:ribosomal protein S18 acetylase RimI-like enzyme
VGTLTLATKKPWAIDPAYFAKSQKPFYLTNMAVGPDAQRRGIGRALIDAAKALAQKEGGDAIRLDAWDAQAGAGPFYAKCGFQEVGRVVYRNAPLIYYELLLR